MRRLYAFNKRIWQILLLLHFLAILAWGGKELYDRLTAKPPPPLSPVAIWKREMAAGKAARNTRCWLEASEHFNAAITQAEKLGRDNPRLAASLLERAEALQFILTQTQYDDPRPLNPPVAIDRISNFRSLPYDAKTQHQHQQQFHQVKRDCTVIDSHLQRAVTILTHRYGATDPHLYEALRQQADFYQLIESPKYPTTLEQIASISYQQDSPFAPKAAEVELRLGYYYEPEAMHDYIISSSSIGNFVNGNNSSKHEDAGGAIRHFQRAFDIYARDPDRYFAEWEDVTRRLERNYRALGDQAGLCALWRRNRDSYARLYAHVVQTDRPNIERRIDIASRIEELSMHIGRDATSLPMWRGIVACFTPVANGALHVSGEEKLAAKQCRDRYPEVLLGLGQVLLRCRHYREAERILLRARREGANAGSLLDNEICQTLAAVYRKLGQTAKANEIDPSLRPFEIHYCL